MKTNLIRPAVIVKGLMFGIILTIVFSSCQSKKTKEQIGKLNSARLEITERLEQLQEEAGKLMMDIENSQEDTHNHTHKHDENCGCEKD